MNRIYIKLSSVELVSSDRGRAYLLYLKIRSFASKKQAGGFTFAQFVDVVKLSTRASRKQINELLRRKFIIDQGNDHYRVVSQQKLFWASKSNKFMTMTNKELFSYSHKNISEFRANISEGEISRYKNHQEAAVAGYRVYNQKDKIYEVFKNEELSSFHNLMASSCSSALLGVSLSTAKRYRKKQNRVNYDSKIVHLFTKNTTWGSKGEQLYTNEDEKGFYFKHKGESFYSPIAIRTNVNGFKLKRS